MSKTKRDFNPIKFGTDSIGRRTLIVAFTGTRVMTWWENVLYWFGKRNFKF